MPPEGSNGMRFRRITLSDRQINEQFWFREQFNAFIDEFDIVAVHHGVPSNMSASSLLRLLQDGSRARARGTNRAGYGDTASHDMTEYHYPLFDHGALWKTGRGNVICTGMPYTTDKPVADWFTAMAKQYKFPDTIKLRFMDDRYKYRPNGHFMIMVYDEDVLRR